MGEHFDPVHPEQAQALIILVVGNLTRWRQEGKEVPRLTGFLFSSYSDVSLDFLRFHAPDLVLSALVGDEYDAVDLARLLSDYAYTGRYRALTTGLPNPAAVLREVRLAAPGLDFDLFDLDNSAFKPR